MAAVEAAAVAVVAAAVSDATGNNVTMEAVVLMMMRAQGDAAVAEAAAVDEAEGIEGTIEETIEETTEEATEGTIEGTIEAKTEIMAKNAQRAAALQVEGINSSSTITTKLLAWQGFPAPPILRTLIVSRLESPKATSLILSLTLSRSPNTAPTSLGPSSLPVNTWKASSLMTPPMLAGPLPSL